MLHRVLRMAFALLVVLDLLPIESAISAGVAQSTCIGPTIKPRQSDLLAWASLSLWHRPNVWRPYTTVSRQQQLAVASSELYQGILYNSIVALGVLRSVQC